MVRLKSLKFNYLNCFSFHLIVKYLIQIGAATNSITVIQTSTLGDSGVSITYHNATSNPNDNSITRHNRSFSILYAAINLQMELQIKSSVS